MCLRTRRPSFRLPAAHISPAAQATSLWKSGLQTLSFLVAALVLLASPVAVAKNRPHGNVSEIQAGGAFSCDFMIPGVVPASAVPPVIERDRMYMAQRPGMLNKHLPVVPDAEGNYLTGGRYLFKTHRQALDYERWTHNEFVLDGEIFVQRALFVGPECRAWKTIGAFQVGDMVENTPVLRTERYSVPDWDMTLILELLYPVLRHQALEKGYTGMWLLYDARSNLVSLVYFMDRVGDYRPGPVPDVATLGTLAQMPRQGRLFELLGWENVFDRTQFTFTIWFPYVKGDRGRPSEWPNSPALPEPYVGDGVCQPSRGETSLTAPEDCSSRCGNGRLDAGENNMSCPSDVPAY